MNEIGANADGTVGGVVYLNMDSDDIQIRYVDGRFEVATEKNNHPVMYVSWHGANAYCEHHGGRLPTEAEWEFAARGGTTSRGYNTYSGSNTLNSIGWHRNNSGRRTHAVGEKKANELRLYDMTGNVWEWCSDWYGQEYYAKSISTDPQGFSSGTYRVFRGGSWFNYAKYCRVANRYNNSPTFTYNYLGFRMVIP